MSDARSRCVHGARLRPTAAGRLRFHAWPMLLARHVRPATRYWRAWTSAGWYGSSSLVGAIEAAASAALLMAAAWDSNCPCTTFSLVPDGELSVLWNADEISLEGVSDCCLSVLK